MNISKKKGLAALAIVLGIVIVVALVLLIYFAFFTEEDSAPKGVVGIVSDDWDVGDRAEQISPESPGVQIPGYSTAEMNEGDTSLHLSIGNPKANSCGFYAVLKLADGTVLYESELLRPGQGLTEIPIEIHLKKGSYRAFVEYQCVTLDPSEAPLNSAQSAFTLVVK